MKIFDCTTFFNEKMMMDIRFNILNEYVSKFIVVESCFSHSGQKKKLNFDINDYPKFKEKIEYIVIENEPKDLFKDEELRNGSYHKRLNSIKRIEQSYEYISNGLDSADDNDLILLSDNDEIPNLSSIYNKKLKADFIIFKQLFFYYKFNLLYDRINWFGTKACKKRKLKNFSDLRNLKNKKYPFWRLDTYFSNIKQTNLMIVDNGGWHFTNIKTPEAIYEKFKNFGHHDEFELSNIDLANIIEKIKNREVFYNHLADKNSQDRWNDNYKLKKINNEILPRYLQSNFDELKRWFD